MEQINLTIFNMINGFAHMNGILDAIMILSAKYMPFLFMLELLYLWFKKGDTYKSIALFSGYSAVFGLFINFIITLLYFHPRPFMEHLGVLLIKYATDTSFPSDHTTFMLSIAFMFLYFKQTRILGILFAVLGLFGGFARVFCGVHFPFDIFGSVVVAITSSFIIFILRFEFNKPNKIILKIYNKLK